MFALTPLVLLVVALAGGGVAAVGNSKADAYDAEQAIVVHQAEAEVQQDCINFQPGAECDVTYASNPQAASDE